MTRALQRGIRKGATSLTKKEETPTEREGSGKNKGDATRG